MATKELVQTITVGAGGAASIEFTSIPQTGTDLLVVLSARRSTAATNPAVYIRFNSDIGANYSFRTLIGDGTTASSNSSSASDQLWGGVDASSGYTASTFGSAQFYVPNYTSSNSKSVSSEGVSENNATATHMRIVAGLWTGTAAITSVTLKPTSGSFAQYSTASLYVVTKGSGGATIPQPLATGGTITYSGGYFYHKFTSSGTFTPTTSLTADIVAIAGGGAGGGTNELNCAGGGGGAGGYILQTSHALTATDYSVTVGAGGTATLGGQGGSGSGSAISSISATGGGGGGRGGSSVYDGLSGGSGGGGGMRNQGGQYSGSGGSGTQNFAGGSASVGAYAAGGGGGASEAGNTDGRPAGGDGVTVSWPVFSTMVAGGGSGGLSQGNTTPGGDGGGGTGAGGGSSSNYSSAGTVNTGGGGGGGANFNYGQLAPSAGGSGIVVVRYPA